MKKIFIENLSKKKLPAVALIIMDAAIISVFIYLVEDINILLSAISECIYSKYGLKCPSCGGTSMIRAILDLSLIKAFLYNPLLFIAFVYGLTSYCYLHVVILTKLTSKHAHYFFNINILYLFLSFMIIFTIIRNL